MPADLKVSHALNTQIKVTPEKPKGYRIQQAMGSLTRLKRPTLVTDTGLHMTLLESRLLWYSH